MGATHLPGALQKLLEVTVGMPWPEGDEGEMWDLARAWRDFSSDLDSLASDMTAEAAAFGEVIQGEFADSLRDFLTGKLHGDIEDMATAANG